MRTRISWIVGLAWVMLFTGPAWAHPHGDEGQHGPHPLDTRPAAWLMGSEDQSDAGESGDAEKPEAIDLDQLLDRLKESQRGDYQEQQGEPDESLPENKIKLTPLLQRIIDEEYTAEDQRAELRLFHGQWDGLGDLDKLPLNDRARLALLRYELRHPSLMDEKADPLLRAEAAIHRGEPEKAIETLKGVKGVQALWLRGQAFESMGNLPLAVRAYETVREVIAEQGSVPGDPEVVCATARSVAALARLQGKPASEFHVVMQWLGRIYSEVDPYYWPARVTEAKLLVEKSNLPDAGNTLMETLALNPNSSEAWYGIGLLSVKTYNFTRADNAVQKLRAINAEHVLADAVAVRSFLKQKDVTSARKVLEPALLRYPTHRELNALLAATEAMAYNEKATDEALEEFDGMAPGSPFAYFTVGQTLSDARQYEWGGAMLRKAIDRSPGWAAPRLSLGLLLMQQGDLPAALVELEKAKAVDPFNTRVNNQLTLVREMLEFPTIETDHFIIRYAPGEDVVLARDMARKFEANYDHFTDFFGHKPVNKSQFDLMPDSEYFAVRITGNPSIWTIAACTGDVISMTPPKVGPKQKGNYDWHNVAGHEYVHTITLAQTKNRIPHWFTEACAVTMETTGRTWDQHQLLAWATHNDKLFGLEDINWGFIRPKEPKDRSLAYAQAAWMLEYLIHSHGREAMVGLLAQYAQGVGNVDAMEAVTGDSAEAFMSGFRDWAKHQVNDHWGLDREAPVKKKKKDVIASLKAEPGTEEAKLIETLLKKHPDHRGFQRMVTEWTVKHGTLEQGIAAVRRYKDACPVDPWAYQQLLKLALKRNDVEATIEAMTFLDRIDNKNAQYAVELTELHRAAGDLTEARAAAWRALYREPYNGTYRETAAALALQDKDMESALFHLESLAMLEPDRAQHQVRLAAIYHRLERAEDADAAARKALEINPNAKVKPFLRETEEVPTQP